MQVRKDRKHLKHKTHKLKYRLEIAYIFFAKALDKLQFLYYNRNGGHLYVVLKTT